MRFNYRLQKILDLREQELEKVKTKFQKAAAEVRTIEEKITKNRNDQLKTQRELVTQSGLSSPQLYINRLKHLKNQLEMLEENLVRAKEKLAIVRQEMLEAQQKTEALKKHKDKKKSEYDKEELLKEEKELNEIALIMRRQQQDNNGDFS
ncbi:MAG: flagellar FliJ family protein [Candidatus Caenarcaniphilales bacterium]|nr:flagellar FliJ family protein [Candidatus Caenarcaniphilales bacterium]